jgi:hypothetical protein
MGEPSPKKKEKYAIMTKNLLKELSNFSKINLETYHHIGDGIAVITKKIDNNLESSL